MKYFFLSLFALFLVAPAVAQDTSTKTPEELRKQIQQLQKQLGDIDKIVPEAERKLALKASLAVKTKFLRIDRDKRGRAMTLDTSVVRYEKDGVIVDLVGAIHVGEKSYYRKLNRQFKQYDVLLYELVAEKGTKPTQDRKPGGNPIGSMQGMMTKVLGLQHQI